MFCWAPVPEPFQALGSLGFAKLLLEEAESPWRRGSVSASMAKAMSAWRWSRTATGCGRPCATSAPSWRDTATGRGRRAGRGMTMADRLRIGIAGLGTVGAGTFRLLREQAELLADAPDGR